MQLKGHMMARTMNWTIHAKCGDGRGADPVRRPPPDLQEKRRRSAACHAGHAEQQRRRPDEDQKERQPRKHIAGWDDPATYHGNYTEQQQINSKSIKANQRRAKEGRNHRRIG
jgi:hypothetical protein